MLSAQCKKDYVNSFDGLQRPVILSPRIVAVIVAFVYEIALSQKREAFVSITRTRVADDTWVFTSGLYVEVNAGLVVTSEGGILIDTLPFPSETKQIIEFAQRVCPQGIQYVINTISHADHVYGSSLFPKPS